MLVLYSDTYRGHVTVATPIPIRVHASWSQAVLIAYGVPVDRSVYLTLDAHYCIMVSYSTMELDEMAGSRG